MQRSKPVKNRSTSLKIKPKQLHFPLNTQSSTTTTLQTSNAAFSVKSGKKLGSLGVGLTKKTKLNSGNQGDDVDYAEYDRVFRSSFDKNGTHTLEATFLNQHFSHTPDARKNVHQNNNIGKNIYQNSNNNNNNNNQNFSNSHHFQKTHNVDLSNLDEKTKNTLEKDPDYFYKELYFSSYKKLSTEALIEPLDSAPIPPEVIESVFDFKTKLSLPPVPPKLTYHHTVVKSHLTPQYSIDHTKINSTMDLLKQLGEKDDDTDDINSDDDRQDERAVRSDVVYLPGSLNNKPLADLTDVRVVEFKVGDDILDPLIEMAISSPLVKSIEKKRSNAKRQRTALVKAEENFRKKNRGQINQDLIKAIQDFDNEQMKNDFVLQCSHFLHTTNYENALTSFLHYCYSELLGTPDPLFQFNLGPGGIQNNPNNTAPSLSTTSSFSFTQTPIGSYFLKPNPPKYHGKYLPDGKTKVNITDSSPSQYNNHYYDIIEYRLKAPMDREGIYSPNPILRNKNLRLVAESNMEMFFRQWCVRKWNRGNTADFPTGLKYVLLSLSQPKLIDKSQFEPFLGMLRDDPKQVSYLRYFNSILEQELEYMNGKYKLPPSVLDDDFEGGSYGVSEEKMEERANYETLLKSSRKAMNNIIIPIQSMLKRLNNPELEYEDVLPKYSPAAQTIIDKNLNQIYRQFEVLDDTDEQLESIELLKQQCENDSDLDVLKPLVEKMENFMIEKSRNSYMNDINRAKRKKEAQERGETFIGDESDQIDESLGPDFVKAKRAIQIFNMDLDTYQNLPPEEQLKITKELPTLFGREDNGEVTMEYVLEASKKARADGLDDFVTGFQQMLEEEEAKNVEARRGLRRKSGKFGEGYEGDEGDDWDELSPELKNFSQQLKAIEQYQNSQMVDQDGNLLPSSDENNQIDPEMNKAAEDLMYETVADAGIDIEKYKTDGQITEEGMDRLLEENPNLASSFSDYFKSMENQIFAHYLRNSGLDYDKDEGNGGKKIQKEQQSYPTQHKIGKAHQNELTNEEISTVSKLIHSADEEGKWLFDDMNNNNNNFEPNFQQKLQYNPDSQDPSLYTMRHRDDIKHPRFYHDQDLSQAQYFPKNDDAQTITQNYSQNGQNFDDFLNKQSFGLHNDTHHYDAPKTIAINSRQKINHGSHIETRVKNPPPTVFHTEDDGLSLPEKKH
jgi:hypothetical protein